MSFQKKLTSNEFTVLAEMHTPKGVNIARLVNDARRIKGRIDAIVVPDMDNGIVRMSALAGGVLMRQEGIVVLGITRKNGRFIGAPDGGTDIQADDVLILYGRAEGICDLDERQHGYTGNMSHQQKMADQKKIEREEKEGDDKQ